MYRYFLHLSFKGTNYAGWQLQENAVSVQSVLNKGLKVLFKEEIPSIGCGRTDSGVHARQFYVHFDTVEKIDDTIKFVHQLNAILPDDIMIFDVHEVEQKAHARFDAISRKYEYFISVRKNPFLKEFAMISYRQFDLEIMNDACRYIIQKSDFSSFSKSNTQVKTNICHVSDASWDYRNGLCVFSITSDRFLRGMVRAIVGTMLDIGMKKYLPQDIPSILDSKNRSDAGKSVPSCGLYLVEIKYPYITPVPSFQFPA